MTWPSMLTRGDIESKMFKYLNDFIVRKDNITIMKNFARKS